MVDKAQATTVVMELKDDSAVIKRLVNNKGETYEVYPAKDKKKIGPIYSTHRIVVDSPLGTLSGLVWTNEDKGETWVGHLKIMTRSARLTAALGKL